MVIKKIEFTNINDVVQIHLSYLDQGLLSSLGEDFLKDFYYALISNNDAFTLVAYKGKKVVGFTSGAINVNQLPIFLIGKLWLRLIKIAIKRPLTIVSLAKLTFYPRFKNHQKTGEIFALSIFPEARKQGVGKLLIKKAKNEFKKRRISRFQISIRDTMQGPNTFYQKIGLKKVKTVSFLGDSINFWQGKI